MSDHCLDLEICTKNWMIRYSETDHVQVRTDLMWYMLHRK